jgi:SNF2 family DNA or RNA helicase
MDKRYIVIFDEIQKFKNVNTKRSKVCKELAQHKNCISRLGLSATYVETGMDNLFGVCLIIDENVFGNNYMNFVNNYITFDWWGKPKEFKNIKMATEKMKTVAIRRNKEQVKDQMNALLPKVNENTLWIELDKEQKKLYNDILDRTVNNIYNMEKAEKISSANAMTELIYVREVSLTTELIEPSIQVSAKIDALLEILPDIIEDNKVVIFSWFTGFVDIIERELLKNGIKCIAMHGKRKEGQLKERQNQIDLFSESKDIKVLVTSDILREGIDIPAASYVINMDILWNPASMTQRNGRIDRLNQQKENIYVINIWAKETIEEAMYEVVYNRETLANQIIDDNVVENRIKKLRFSDIKKMLEMCRSWK